MLSKLILQYKFSQVSYLIEKSLHHVGECRERNPDPGVASYPKILTAPFNTINFTDPRNVIDSPGFKPRTICIYAMVEHIRCNKKINSKLRSNLRCASIQKSRRTTSYILKREIQGFKGADKTLHSQNCTNTTHENKIYVL